LGDAEIARTDIARSSKFVGTDFARLDNARPSSTGGHRET